MCSFLCTSRRSAVWLRPLGGATARPCRDQYWVLWGDEYSVLFQLFARGVTAMSRGPHAGLCHAFLVIFVLFKMFFFVSATLFCFGTFLLLFCPNVNRKKHFDKTKLKNVPKQNKNSQKQRKKHFDQTKNWRLYCVEWHNQYSIRPKRSAIRTPAVYFLHSTMPGVKCLRLSDVSVVCRVTYLQFPIYSAFLQYIGRQAASALRLTIGFNTLSRTSDVAEKLGRYLSCAECTTQGIDFELILTVKCKLDIP